MLPGPTDIDPKSSDPPVAHNNKPHIAEIKLKLAEKYARLSTLAGSVPKRRRFAYMADRYRRQAAEVTSAGKTSATE